MQHSPPEIKDKLLKALDSEYNVVDMVAVLEIISILEKTPITKEALEATRLGKHINEFRRKTDNESLAKRAKDLVRRWRDMIMPSSTASSTPPSEPATVNGSGGVTGPGPGGTKPCRSTVTSPAMSTASSSSPGLTSLRKIPSLPPSPTPGSTGSLASLGSSRASPRLPPARVSHAPNSEIVARTHANNKRLRKDADSNSPDKDGPPPAKRRATPNGIYPKERLEESAQSASNIVPLLDCIGKSNKSSSITTTTTPSSVSGLSSQTLVSSDNDIVKAKMAQIGRSAKVKTTRELLDDLKARGGSPPPVSATSSKEDSEPSSRHRALNSLLAPRSPDEVSRNKTEHLAKFLSSQAEDDRPLKRCFSPSPLGSPTSRDVREILSALPQLDPNSIVWSDHDDDEEEAVLTSDDENVREQNESVKEVSGELLESVLSGEKIEGVTGNVDFVKTDVCETNADESRTDFKEWHEHVWRESYDGQPFLVWPYVITD